MDKKRLIDELNQIQVPTSELQDAIKNGIARAKKEKEEKPVKNKKNLIRSSGIAAAVTLGVLGSGFIFPQMGGILANFPYLSQVYSTFQDETGETLLNKDLVTELNEEVVSEGVAVKATSAYYDNRKITVTFEVDKEELKVLHEDIEMFPFDFKIIKDGRDWKLDSDVSPSFNAKYDEEKGYMIIELIPPGEVPEKNYTLPITLTNVGGTEGEWKFNIAVEQLENKETKIGQTFTDKNGEYTFTIDKLIHGQGSTIIEHTVRTKYKDDNVDFFFVYDQNGNEYQFNGTQERDVKKVGDYFEIKYQTPVTKMPEDIESFTFEMSHHRSESDVTVPVNKLPYTAQSTRTGEKFIIRSVEQKDRKVIVDYEVKIEDGAYKEHLLDGRLDQLSFSLYETDFLGKKDKRYDIPEKGTYLKWNGESKVIHKDKGHIQAIFNLDGELKDDGDYLQPPVKHIDLDKYSLIVPMYVFHAPPASTQVFKVDVK
jgi:Domain of unknown function (DUF4179)